MSLQSHEGAKPNDSIVNKRVVLMHKNGMQSIAGEFKPDQHELRPFIEIDVHNVKKPFGLIKITPRIIYYREIVAPVGLKTFNERQI